MKFINCDFSKADYIELKDSSLTQIELINTHWGTISEKRICKELFEKYPNKARDIYRQLKFTLDNQKDHITANEFYSLEMKAYERYLKTQGWNKENWQERLVFTIHKWASNFGQSWLKPLGWILILTVLVSSYFYLDLEDIKNLYNEHYSFKVSIKEISNGIENFFKTLNIFKIFKNDGCMKEVPFYHTITSLYAILLAFLTYQFIVAVRRRVKR